MQDRYVGDIGDFGKLGLLRSLIGETGLRLGVAWYRVPDESHNNDGRYVDYLEPANADAYRPCDPELYDALAGIIAAGNRSVSMIEQAPILPIDTVYHGQPLSFAGVSPRQRPELRRQWLATMVDSLAACEIVFADPDNGIECSTGCCDLKGPKFVYWGDLDDLMRPARSLVIYHHLGRRGSHPSQIEAIKNQIASKLHVPVEAMWFRRGSGRVYLIAMAPSHQEAFSTRLSRMAASPWSAHFTRC